ncbi:ena/VASP-like protein isoform X2 [Ovis aries]|uniref:Enah/Vasp-like n=1 Tax=Ovis aries TaxID=9940 RepID=A0AC11BWQ4_SHEEP|nr:ena/VASP-like protein isoform X2 [Ovis aries]
MTTVEQSICQARASVMVYDDTSKKWVPIKPGQQGFSRINIYHNTASNTFRVVGVKLQDQQVVINYSIVKGLKYNQATPTFHQWRDARQVYGLNFASKEEATTFSNAMLFALNIMNSQEGGPSSQRQVQNGPSPDEMDIQRRQVMEHQHQQRQESLERRASAPGPSLQPGHPSSAACAPLSCSGPPPPPPPPVPPPPTGATPPPPPPLPAGGAQGTSHDESSVSGLAAALAGAKLRRVQRPEDASGGSSPSGSSKSDANRASSGGGGGGLMEEMNKLLAKRRKAASQTDKPADKKEDESQTEEPSTSPSPGTRAASQQPPNPSEASRKPWERSGSAEKPMSSSLSRTPSVAKSPEAKNPLQAQPHSTRYRTARLWGRLCPLPQLTPRPLPRCHLTAISGRGRAVRREGQGRPGPPHPHRWGALRPGGCDCPERPWGAAEVQSQLWARQPGHRASQGPSAASPTPPTPPQRGGVWTAAAHSRYPSPALAVPRGLQSRGWPLTALLRFLCVFPGRCWPRFRNQKLR